MFAAQRRDLLLQRLRTDGRVIAKDLAAELGMSEDSIRRDLRDLAAAGRSIYPIVWRRYVRDNELPQSLTDSGGTAPCPRSLRS